MANTLTLTIDILTKDADKLDKIIDKVEKLNRRTETGGESGRKFGGGINAATLAAGAAAAAVGLLTSQIGGYVKSSIDAAARTEGLRNGLRTVIPDANEFEKTSCRGRRKSK